MPGNGQVGGDPATMDEPGDPLVALVERLSGGDVEAMHGIVLTLQDELGRLLSWHLDQHAVDEVLQETFLTVYRRIATFRQGNFRAWVKTIARNHMLHHLRGRRRLFARHAADIDNLLAEQQVEAFDEGSGDDDTFAAAPVQALRQCLEQLAPRARALIERRYQAGESLARLAAAFKQSKATLACSLCRIRSRLRQCIEEVAPHGA